MSYIGRTPSTDVKAASFYYTAFTGVDSTSFITLDSWKLDFAHDIYSVSSGVVTVSESGLYEINTSLGIQDNAETNNYRYTCELEFLKNGTTRIAATSTGYLRRRDGNNYIAPTLKKTVELNADDTVEVRIKRLNDVSGGAFMATTPSRNNFDFVKLERTL